MNIHALLSLIMHVSIVSAQRESRAHHVSRGLKIVTLLLLIYIKSALAQQARLQIVHYRVYKWSLELCRMLYGNNCFTLGQSSNGAKTCLNSLIGSKKQSFDAMMPSPSDRLPKLFLQQHFFSFILYGFLLQSKENG